MPKKFTTHGQIRQLQAGFASARGFLRAGECGKQQAQKGRHGLVLTLQKCFSACRIEGHEQRKRAHGQKETHPILCSHKSSKLVSS